MSTQTKTHKTRSIDAALLKLLISYSSRYEISVQFWPNQLTVYIAKDGVDLYSYGGDGDEAIHKSVEYLDRINKTSKLKP